MILAAKQEDKVEITGEANVKKMGIDQDSIAILQMMLSKGLYEDPITAIIAEYVNNSVDSIVDSGKNPIEHPVIVKIGKDNQGWYFSVKDEGLGLDNDDFENILGNYLKSTKRNSNSTIGCYGLGSKSGLSYSDSVYFTCRKNGIERKYMLFKGEEFSQYTLLHEQATSEPNGVEVFINIKSYWDFEDFKRKSKQKLAYYDTVVLLHNDVIVSNSIHRSENWQHSELNNDYSVHLCLKDVYYSIDFDKLGIKDIHCPIALRFGLDDGITPTPSREGIIYDEKTKKLILDKMAKVADEFFTKYNKNREEVDNIVDIWDEIIDNNKYINYDDLELEISSFKSISTIPTISLKVKDISIRDVKYYYHQKYSLVNNIEIIGYKESTFASFNKSQRAKYKDIMNILIDENDKVLLCNHLPRGYEKDYLLEKYHKSGEILFVKLKNTPNEDLRWFKNTLGLHNFDKSEWRARINEFLTVRQQIISRFIDVRDEKIDEEWLNNKKKQKRQFVQKSSYKGLNKQEGDITLGIGKINSRGSITYEKSAWKIGSLYKNPHLFVYFTEEPKEAFVKAIIKSDKKKLIKFCLVGKREVQKIPNIHNFITMKEFTEKSKPFRRIASATKITEILNLWYNLDSSNSKFIQSYSNKIYDDIQLLKKYQDENSVYVANISKEIIDIAEEMNIWDEEIQPLVRKVENFLKDVEFIQIFDKPTYYRANELSIYNNTISKMLLFNKLYKGAFADYELVEKVKEEEIELIEESQY